MKCIKVQDTYKRVSNEVADNEVSFGRATYAPKSEWKKNVREISKPATVSVADEKGKETKSKKAEKAAKLKEKQHPKEYSDNILK